MTTRDGKGKQKDAGAAKAGRLKAALKANLKRRKAQAQARKTDAREQGPEKD
jgi:hypothetical protein